MSNRVVYLPDAFSYSDQISDPNERDRTYGLLQRFLRELPVSDDKISIDIDVWRRAVDLMTERYEEIDKIRDEREKDESLPF